MNTDRQILQHCLNLIGRLSPRSIESHLLTLLKLLPFVVQSKLDTVVAPHVNADEPWHSDLVMALSQELLNLVDVPLKIITDEESKKKEEFLISEYNRDGDAYRSPFSNRYILPNPEACSQDDEWMETLYFPGKKLRLLEILMNDAITVYRDM